MPLLFRLLRWALVLGLAALLVAALAGGIVYHRLTANLPPIESLREVKLQEPMYVYTRDGKLIGLFGEIRRYPVAIAEVPLQVRQAFVAAEDSSFYRHGGVDPKGVSRALWQVLTKKQGRVAGGSTITQQVARQFFLTNEVSYTRKAAEMVLAMRIERMLSKDQILELYLNNSFFGNRAHGVVAAAEFYYGKPLKDLSLAETASLVSSLKFPSSGNPLSNPQRNHQRSVYVIERMREDGYVSPAQAAQAEAEAVQPAPHERPLEAYAPYAAEMVRQEMVARFGPQVLESGYHVTTTLDSTLQSAADQAVRDGLRTYDQRHGWRGPEKKLAVGAGDDDAALARQLAGVVGQGGLSPAVVAATSADGSAAVVTRDGRRLLLPAAASRWTGRSP
ncbi:MAG: transglycosylase domain-containing protein, partial [Pseudoxanthomonas sp.]